MNTRTDSTLRIRRAVESDISALFTLMRRLAEFARPTLYIKELYVADYALSESALLELAHEP